MNERIVNALNKAGIPAREVNGQIVSTPQFDPIVQVVVANYQVVYAQIENARGRMFTGDK